MPNQQTAKDPAYAPAPAVTAPTYDPQETNVTQPHDHTTAALAARWTAVPNTDLDCWRITTPNLGVVDLVYDQETAEHIAGLHNARLAGISAFQAASETQPGDHLADGSTVVTVLGVIDAAGREYTALSDEDALDVATSPNPMYGPHPRQTVAWTVTTSAPVPYEPATAVASAPVSEVAA